MTVEEIQRRVWAQDEAKRLHNADNTENTDLGMDELLRDLFQINSQLREIIGKYVQANRVYSK